MNFLITGSNLSSTFETEKKQNRKKKTNVKISQETFYAFKKNQIIRIMLLGSVVREPSFINFL